MIDAHTGKGLKPAQRRHLESRLLEERDRVLRALRAYRDETSDTLRSESGDVPAFHQHMADLGTDTAQREFDAANAARLSHELAEIDAALEKLYQRPDEYGRCERTGELIPLARLDLIPWARTR